MRHDIIHCYGIGCQLREDCLRYNAHLEIQGNNDGRYKYFLFNNYNSVHDTCVQFIWKEK